MCISLVAWVGMFVWLIGRDHLRARGNPSPCSTSSSNKSSMSGPMHLMLSHAHDCISNKHPPKKMMLSLTTWARMFVWLIGWDHLHARGNPSPCCSSSSDRSSMSGAMHFMRSHTHGCSSNKHPPISVYKDFTARPRAQKIEASTIAPQL